MSEDYRIISQARGEPRPAGHVGVLVRLQLSGCPSRRWSRNLGGRLTRELVGRPGVGHLRISANDIVQGDQIVLEGVEASEARALADALQRAVDAANRATTDEVDQASNVTQREADAVAAEISMHDPSDTAIPRAVNGSPCPRCGQVVPITAENVEPGAQLAIDSSDCPGCGARLIRDVDGHVDRGWRVGHE
jgi:RNA polymerase-binding transcription factor DksA